MFEIQKRAKEKFRKSFKTFKDAKKKVREIKRSRQPYLPVVALGQPGDGSSVAMQPPVQKPSFKYDRKPSSSGKDGTRRKGSGKSSRREEANLAEASLVTEFNYMVEAGEVEEELLLASVPLGFGIIDAGCATPVVGQEVARDLHQHLTRLNIPKPEPCQLPPAELKGFAGQRTVTTDGIRWHVQLGDLWGTITTYVVPGKTPFLISRRVLEGMQASLDLGRRTITSLKHGFDDVPLMQAANGHLLLPLHAQASDWDSHEIDRNEPKPNALRVDLVDPDVGVPDVRNADGASEVPEAETVCPQPVVEKRPRPRVTDVDRKRAMQHMAKNTTDGIIDLQGHQQSLQVLFGTKGSDIVHGFVAYRPRKERIPDMAIQSHLWQSSCSLSKQGEFRVLPWRVRPPGPRTACEPENLVLFAYRTVPPEPEDGVPDLGGGQRAGLELIR